jgi:predicted dehydrogenase
MADNPTRRDLLKLTASAAAAIAAPASAGRVEARIPQIRLDRDVRVAIIGLEGHYSEILDEAKTSPMIRITAVAEENPDLLRRETSDALLAKAKSYSDYRKLLDREQLDVVAICGENAVRAGIVLECAERKLAVVAEKPLAITLEDLSRIRAEVEKARIPLTLLLSMRFEPAYQKMRSIVKEGEIGEVVTVAAQKSYKLGDRPEWMKSRASFGGIIPYIGIHMIDLMRWTSGRDFVEAAAFQSNVGAPQIREMENNAAMIFRLDNHGTGSLRMDYLRPETAPTHGDDRLRIAGTRGVVEFQEGRGVTLVSATRKVTQITDLPPVKRFFADFLDSLYGGGKPPISLEDVFRVSEIVLKVRAAAETSTLVKL